MRVCKDMGGYRCMKTWEGTDVRGNERIFEVCGHGTMQMYEDMGGCRYVGTWEDTDM